MKRAPRLALPGRPVRGSRTGRPVMALLDLLGRRWVLRILWELREEPAASFRDLQVRCGNVSSSVLNDRLRELREAAIVAAREPSGYQLTERGTPSALRRWRRSTSGPRAGSAPTLARRAEPPISRVSRQKPGFRLPLATISPPPLTGGSS